MTSVSAQSARSSRAGAPRAQRYRVAAGGSPGIARRSEIRARLVHPPRRRQRERAKTFPACCRQLIRGQPRKRATVGGRSGVHPDPKVVPVGHRVGKPDRKRRSSSMERPSASSSARLRVDSLPDQILHRTLADGPRGNRRAKVALGHVGARGRERPDRHRLRDVAGHPPDHLVNAGIAVDRHRTLDELALAPVAVSRHNEPPSDVIGDRGTMIAPDEVQA